MTSSAAHRKFSGVLIVVGSLLFVYGGAFHPHINSSIGPLGSSEFFDNFRMKIAHHDSWERIHAMIMAGPLLWLMGVRAFWNDRNGWTRMAASAMTMAASIWSVTFVLDGFIAPYIVHSLAPESGRDFLAVNQNAVIRLGLVSWLTLGFSMIVGSVGTLVSDYSVKRSRSSLVLAGTGIVLGLWAFVAWVSGTFLPGPFTSPYWNVSAVGVASWFLAAGAVLLLTAQPQCEISQPVP